MNTDFVIPFAVSTVLAAATIAAGRISFPADAPVDGRIVDLPPVTVRASPQDVAYFRAHRIVDLARITVFPESTDLALLLATSTVRIAHSPVCLPQTPILDRQAATASFDALRRAEARL